MVRLVAPLAAVLLAACPQVNDAPEQGVQASPTTAAPETAPGEPTYEVGDVRLVRRDDPIADVVWSVSFDASWTGPGPPERTKCRWRLLDDEGLTMVVGAVYLEEPEVDDQPTAEVFPDEIAGVPKGAAVTC